MKRYPKYKETNIPWLKEIPEHWELARNKNVLFPFSEVVGAEASKYKLLSLTMNGVIARDLENPKGKFPKDFDTYQKVRPGNLIMCLFDVDETPRTVGLSDTSGMITGAYDIFEISDKVLSHFIYYYYIAVDDRKAMRPLYTGLRKVVKLPKFLQTQFPVPPLAEQKRIVEFLDDKVKKIDDYVAAKSREIELLKEQKQAVINQAVTRGLNPNAPLKDSGVPWLGMVPEHWGIVKIKRLFEEDDERNTELKYELMSFSKSKGIVPFSSLNEKEASASDLSKYRVIHPGQLLENRMQAWHGMFICVDKDGCISPDYSVFNVRENMKVCVKFYEHIFRNPIWVQQFANASKGIGDGFNRLYTPQFGAVDTLYPPLAEQQEIVAFLDEKCAKFDATVANIEKQINNVKEYKQRLINDAVTGKIDLRA